ncbi:hypothetical protein CEXT_321591 [Caerostris extrusa]|uniref:Uncharacterized protein n=1 Tax=Caerostris extrusa TaxID=172846 RepID=A0AAV4MIA7_CAEEX|nr:hypothetical protein CEXT_321591 [Caerostris extrusa]
MYSIFLFFPFYLKENTYLKPSANNAAEFSRCQDLKCRRRDLPVIRESGPRAMDALRLLSVNRKYFRFSEHFGWRKSWRSSAPKILRGTEPDKIVQCRFNSKPRVLYLSYFMSI